MTIEMVSRLLTIRYETTGDHIAMREHQSDHLAEYQ
jgi:hypothetical protein